MGEGIQQWKEGEWASGTAGICIPLSSVTGWERWGDTGAKNSGGFWQDCGRGSEIKDATLQDLTITPRCLASAGRDKDTEINNEMSDSNRRSIEKEGAVNTHLRA